MKKTNRIKTKILAAALSATMVFSFGAMTATTASAATNWNIGLSDDTQKEITDGFFSGASTMIGLLTKSHPVAGVIASGLFGAFKSFYGDATKTPQPSNQDIVNLLGELSDKIDDHFSAQSSQVKALQNIQNLQNFSKILTSVKGYNENAMGQIAIFDEDNVCAQDYQNIIDCTVGNDEFVKDFMDLSNCNFVNNSANKGGAIFADYDATVTNSIFTGNSAAANGGAIMFDYRGRCLCESLTLTGSTFTDNTAGSNGGAIFCDSMNYLTMSDVEIRNNTAGSNGGGLYCQKGSSSSCDPDISGKITIIDNQLTNGTKSNAFLGENKTSKCVFKITDNIDPSSRIGVTSNTNDGDLDICKIWNKDAYKNTANVFSYDTDKYKINRYTHWYSDFWWVEIVKK